jgi:hypothetical protein
MKVCVVCRKQIPEDEEYACVWMEEDGSLSVGFAHLGCSEEGLEDITDEVKGRKQ